MPSGGIKIRFGAKPYKLQASTSHYQHTPVPMVANTTVAPSIITASVPAASVGTAYSYQLAATGGTPPYTWSVSSSIPGTGGFPSCSTSGLLTGTPSTAETEALVIQISDRATHTATKSFSLLVNSNVVGFTPDAGWGYSSTATTFDQSFTINRPANDLGSPPILALYDDFVSASAGNMPTSRTPTAGIRSWTSGGGTGSPIFVRQNASGTGFAMSHMNNEIPGSAGVPFGRDANISFGQDVTCAYLEYQENWRGWTGRNNNGGGGGYYKHNWFMENGGYGATTFDCVTPDFLEQSSDMSVLAASWAAGTMTVTTSNFGSLRRPGTTNWQTWVRGSSNASWNAIANVTATYIDDTHFSFPLAADPGAIGGAVIIIPGGGDLHQSGTPSANINTAFAANNSHFGGAKTIAGDSNGISLWDPGSAVGNSGWNTVCSAIIGDPVNPTTANTTLISQLYNAVNHQAINYSTSAVAIFNSAAGYQAMNQVQVVGLLQNTSTCTVDRSNYYLTIGPNAVNGFCLSDGATPATATFMQSCTHTAWSSSQATVVLRQGRASALSGLYLYWRSPTFTLTRVGRFN